MHPDPRAAGRDARGWVPPLVDLPRCGQVKDERVADFERDVYRFMDSVGKNVTAKIAKDKAWSPEIEKEVRAMLDEFKKTNSYTEEKAPPAAATSRKEQPSTPKLAAKTPATKA